MIEIKLNLKWLNNPMGGFYRQEIDRTRDPFIAEILARVANKEDVFIKFTDKHPKRPGAIAKIAKIEDDSYAHSDYSNFVLHLKWDGRKNKTKVKINSERVVYLPDYQGETVWHMFDPKAYAKENEEIVYDRLGKELTVGDIVVLINTRYGSGGELDFGVIREIKQKGLSDYRGNYYVDVTTVIETIIDTPSQTCKINRADRSIIKITDVDLLDEAVMHKLRAI